MKDFESDVKSLVNLNALAKSIFSETIEMGFKSNDYVKLMNEILDMTMKSNISQTVSSNDEEKLTKLKTDLPITTNNLLIRDYNPKTDKKILQKWFEEENNKLFLLSTTSKSNLDIETIENNERNLFATITLLDKTPIGLIALINIDKKNSKGEMRKMIGEVSERGKGFAKEATKIWLKYCSEVLGINKIYINTIETNIKNITINRHLGFQVEGLLKKECVINDVEHDILRMAYFKNP
jgi:diamine N-acetyltransferase